MKILLIFIAKILLTSAYCPYDGATHSSGIAYCVNSKMIDAKICTGSNACPSGFTSGKKLVIISWCYPNSGNSAIIFDLQFSSIKDLTATYIASSTDSSIKFQNPGSIWYMSSTQNSPLPTIDRGFYFATTSSTSNSNGFIPGCYFTLNIWIKPLNSGEILNVIYSSTSYIRIWADSSGVYKFTMFVYDSNNNQASQTATATISYTSSWHTASMIINQSSCDTANISFYIDGNNVGNTAFSSTEARVPKLGYTWTIGNTSGGNSFRGFIYWLQTRADCAQSTAALTATINCVDNQYWDGSSCQNCDSNCPTWPWCIRGTDCITCNVLDCITCKGYPPLTCINCNTGVVPNCCDYIGTACSQTWTNTGCTTGNFLVANVCLYACPYGFGNCAAVNTAVITADFTGTFAGSYGTALKTGTSSASYNYWNSPESSDPKPAKNRGIYFDSNQYLSGSINLSNTWTMAMWVYAISGTIISHSTNKLAIDSSGTATFYLEKWDGSSSPSSYSVSQSITSYTWTYISYSLGFANKVSTMTPYLNKIAGTPATITDYIFRLPPAGTLYIGKGSPNFNGFIAYFILWQVAISDFSAYYSINTLTGGSVSSFWSCDYMYYYDGSACTSCLDSSCTNGCTRGTSCYICDDFLCAQCSSFWSGSCTQCITNASGSPCSCNSGFYQPYVNQALCSACYAGCAHCTGSYYYLCTSCSSSSYFYNSKMCLPDCPTGYTKNTGTGNCDLSSIIPLSLSFSNQILLDQLSGKQVGSSFSNSYPTYDSNDPIPAYLRGYYFNSNSYLTTMFMLAPNFSISLWIKATSSGMVITKYVSTTQWFVQILSSGCPKLSLLLMDSSSTVSVIGSSNVLNNWFFISFDSKINSDGTTTISSYIDAASQVVSTSLSPLYLLDSKTGNFYIGLYSGGFIGFLWELKIYCQSNHALDDWQTAGCSGSCTKCPADFSCPDNCPLTGYYDGSPCASCINTCNQGCRNSDSCNLCKTKECATCTEFTGTNSCLTCITNAVSDGNGGCTCASNAFWVSSSQTCEICDALCSTCLKTTYFECSNCSGINQLAGSVCLNECPYSTSCSTVTAAVIDQSFDTDFQGSYGIFTTGTSAATFQFSSSPESVDPIPAYKRGLYFDGTMYLLSSTTVYISHSFSIGLWLYVITNGDLLQKQSLLKLTSTGSIEATMIDPAQVTSSQTLAPGLSFTGWAYLSVTFEYSLGGTTLTIYVNGVSSSTSSITKKIYRDQPSTYLILGKSNNPGFVGFIYYFQLWNTAISGFPAIISSFTFCDSGQGASCLWACDLSSYKNGASISACSSCTNGCRRSSTCNICDDPLCITCTGFDSGKCTQCDPSVTLSSGLCLCNAGFGRSTDGLSCASCFSGCSLCLAVTYNKCTACSSGYFFANTGQCLVECPSGYTQNSGAKTCDWASNLGISLDLTDQVRLDIVSGFNVGNSNTNTYSGLASSDLNDPIPSYKRGYYFYKSDYLSSTVMIAPSFTISLWIKPMDHGILMTKYTSAEILKIEVDTSGFPVLSIVFDDSSTQTLTTSTSLILSWHFLSFTCQVQDDGKSIVKLYIDNSASFSSITSVSSTYFKDTNAGSLYVGNDETFGTSGLYGFLARLMIYNAHNYRSDDYATSSCTTGCSACPSNHQCLSDCAVNEYPDSCTVCKTGCSEGCVNGLTCRLCRDKECLSCTTFSGECSSCITNAHKVNTHCECIANTIWDSDKCEPCDTMCLTCSTLKYNGCLTCISSYYLIQSFCMPFCPTGYIINGGNCDSDPSYSNYFIFNLMPHQIKDIVIDLKSNIHVLTGKDNKFYPVYDSTDPIAAIYRGYYFSGSSYMQLPPYAGATSPLLTFSPNFVISAWIKPISSTGVIFSKQVNSSPFKKYISLELINKAPSLTLTLKDSNIKTFTSANPSLEATLSQWNFISASSSISATPQQIISLVTNGIVDTSSDLGSSWLSDLENSFLITIGAGYISPSTLASFFNGFLWDLKIYNTLIAVSGLTSSTCSGCSLCPIDNSNSCLDSCDIDQYWNGNSCVTCSSGCLMKGCVRIDKSCNLCKDTLCEVCDDYTNTCITCKTHATLISTSCQCNSGYFLDSTNESCSACDASCKTCTSSNSLDCQTCSNGFYNVSGICTNSCPLGYSPSGGVCVLVQEKIFDLDLNTLNGVVYDKVNSIPVITGSTKQFYPNYETDDPIPAYLRGFYLNGEASVLRMPEYSNYLSPRLVITSTFTISIWANTETSYGTLLSKQNISDSYSTLYSTSLMSSQASISFNLSSFQIFYMCNRLINSYEWSHIVFTLELTQNSYSKLSCYINGLSDTQGLTVYGIFQDKGPHTTMSIGAQLSSGSVFNFYKGFIYSIQIFNSLKSISSLSTASCTESCSVCPTSKACIPNCKINEYWSGPAYNKCYQCNAKCKKTCRDWRSTCSLCDNLLCDSCNDYSSAGCTLCKENSINPSSCICDIYYVLDYSNNSSCIPVEAGGFRGPDGKLYPCPSLCTYCESSTKCNSCVDNASLTNDLCYCNLGYNGTKNCTLVPFSIKLTVLSDNSLYFTFSESLANSLSTNDFIIKIQKQGEVSYKMEEVNSTCYYISLVISKEISKGTLATVEFSNLTDIRSISNGILNSSDISAPLNSYDPAPYSAAVEAITSKAAAGVQAAIAGAVALSIVNPNPSSLWSMINSLQILSYLTLSGIPMSSKMYTFLNNLNSFNLFPNIFTYIIDKNEGNTPYSQAQDFGFDSDLILITQGNDFTIILASLSALPAVFFFSRCSFRWIGKKFMKTVKVYQFGFYLRFWIQCYLELGAAASIGLITFGLNNFTQITNFILCLAVYILLVITPPGYFWFSYKNKNRIQSREKSFTELFSSFFYEFRVDRGLLATQYYFVFFIRRFIYIINLIFLREYPQTEVTINIVLSLMTILHLIFFWPFEDPVLQINNLLTEIMICLVMSSTSVYLFNIEQEIVSTIENAIVAIVIGVMIIQSFSSIAIFARTLYGIIHHKLTKAGIMRNSIQPLNDSHKKIEK